MEEVEPVYLLRRIALFLEDVKKIELQFEPLKIADIQADTKERILRVGKTENPIKECRDLGISNAEILDVMPNLLNNPIIVGDLNGMKFLLIMVIIHFQLMEKIFCLNKF